MRIKAIRLGWFRGAGSGDVLETNGKSVVVYGQNGAGKSSFVDAIEYVIGDGKIAHLTHEYSGRNQEKAIINTHTPVGGGTELAIKFFDDTEINVKIAKDGTYTKSGAEAINMGAWEYRRTVLRQDEISEFIRSSKGDKYSALLPLLGLQEMEVAAENLRQLVRPIEEQSNLRQKKDACDGIKAKRNQFFSDNADVEIPEKIDVLHKKYCPESQVTEVLNRCKELDTVIPQRINDLSAEALYYNALRIIANVKLVESVNAVRNANAKMAGSVEPLISEKLAVLQSSNVFVEKLEESNVPCPACGRSIAANEFKMHVKDEQSRLKEIIAVFNERKTAINTLINDINVIKTTLIKPEIKAWSEGLKQNVLRTNVEWFEQYDADELRHAVNESSLKDIDDNCHAIIKAADEASQFSPLDVKELSRDKSIVDVVKATFEANKTLEEISRIEKMTLFIKSIETGIRGEIRECSNAIIAEISDDIRGMWKVLHPDNLIEDVRLYLPENADKAIDIALKFYGKDQGSPRLTLSEGYRNSLGLCIFLAMAKHEAKDDNPVFLDDVVVSLDRNHRGMIFSLLENEFPLRQVLIFTHDRDWYTELRRQLDEKTWLFKMLLPYATPEFGIRFSRKTTTFDDARAHLADRPDSAGNDARKIMDVELGIIAERLQIRLQYLRGDKNDSRMCKDFLDRIISDGNKCLQRKGDSVFFCDTNAISILEKADKLLISWGNKSSHSTDIMRSEASMLIDVCEQALEIFKCSFCKKQLWFMRANSAEYTQCECGTLRWCCGKVA